MQRRSVAARARPRNRPNRPLAEAEGARHHGSMDERDVTPVMEALFDIRSRVVDIHEEMFPPEDDDGEAEEEEDA